MDYRIAIKKTKGKKLYVDPMEEEGFFLYPGEIRKAGLKEGMIISGDDLLAIHEEYAIPRARRYALGLLARKDMTQKELVEKLEKSLNDSRSIAAAMAFVTEHGYIDDERYVEDYIYSHKGKKSFLQIKEVLLRKGVAGDIIRRVIEEEGQQSAEDIRPLVEKYARKFPELDFTSTRKILMHFGRKGYSIHTVQEILRDLQMADE